jgi:FkbM family methyltransferase
MTELFRLRASKAWFAATHPSCWRALSMRVAPSIEHQAVLKSLNVDRLIDVGGNRGQFSLMARLEHPHLQIHAFEPLPGEAAVYRKVFSGDPAVTLHEMALGETAGVAELHLSRRADSSSLLPIGELQSKLFPSTDEVGTLKVRVAALDDLIDVWGPAKNALLKLDVQGFELSVLKGARGALRNCAFVYAECSEIPLYTGQALFPEVAGFLAGEGFKPVRRANEQFVDGKLVQADHLFQRAAV